MPQVTESHIISKLCCSDRETEGVWQNYYTGEEINLSSDITGPTTGGKDENCAILVAAWNGYADWICQANKVLTLSFLEVNMSTTSLSTLQVLSSPSPKSSHPRPKTKPKPVQN